MRTATTVPPGREDSVTGERVERAVLDALPDEHVAVRASVSGGVVLLLGRVEYRSTLRAIDPLVRAVPGVAEVCNRMSFLWNDEVG
jgi:osmotically-inducible protein OsmY